MQAAIHARLSPVATQSTALDVLREQGYCIMSQLAPRSLIAAIVAELEPWFDATPLCRGDFYGWQTTRLGALLLKSASCHSLVLQPQLTALCDAILQPHCDWYQLNLTQAVRIHPGERQQAPHRDEEMWPCEKRGAEFLINVLWPLTEFTTENGATMVWPKGEEVRDRALDPSQAVCATMSPGDALIYLGSTTHCAGANRSSAPRSALIFSYSLGWLKQYENAFLAYPPAVARAFPKPLRDLIGYRIHRPNLGGYEGQDPSVLFTTSSHTLPAIDALPQHIAEQLTQLYEPRGA
jgi:hypothetical protein